VLRQPHVTSATAQFPRAGPWVVHFMRQLPVIVTTVTPTRTLRNLPQPLWVLSLRTLRQPLLPSLRQPLLPLLPLLLSPRTLRQPRLALLLRLV
jgi:hypothetical protein